MTKEQSDGFGPRSHRRRRQLRRVARPGREYYKDADPTSRVPGLMHVQFGDYHVRDVEFVAAFDVDAKKVGLDLVRGDRRQREQHDQDLRRAADRRHRPARPHPRRPRQVLPRDHHRVRRRAGRRRRRRCATAKVDVLVCYLPVGSEDAAKFYAQCAIDAGVALRQRAAGVHRRHPGVGREVHRRRRADRRRRHQVAGRRHHHAPRAGQAVRGPRRRSSTAPTSSTSAATWTS